MINRNSVRLSQKAGALRKLYGICSAEPYWMPIERVVPVPWHMKNRLTLSHDGHFEILDPISQFLSQNFENPPLSKVVANFIYFTSEVFDKSLLDFIEEDDIYVEFNGAISIELHKDSLKTFISIGEKSCGYYIRENGNVVLQKDSIDFDSSDIKLNLSSLKKEILRLYQHPIVNKLYNRIDSQPITFLNEV